MGATVTNLKDPSRKVSSRTSSDPLSGWGEDHRKTTWDWGMVNEAGLIDALTSVTVAGALISFSLTSDGGACKVYVLNNKRPKTAYAASAEAFDTLMSELVERFGVPDSNL